jgi:hypothetical protein
VLVALAFLPSAEVLAAALVWLALMLAGLAWFAAGGAEAAMNMLMLVPLAIFIRFLRMRVTGRL